MVMVIVTAGAVPGEGFSLDAETGACGLSDRAAVPIRS